MAAALATQGVSHRCHTRAITMSCHRHQRPVAAAMSSKSGFSNTSTTGWRRVGECCCCCCHGRDGRRAAGRYSASRWTPPPTSEKGEEEDDGSIELDAEEAVPGIEMPSGVCVCACPLCGQPREKEEVFPKVCVSFSSTCHSKQNNLHNHTNHSPNPHLPLLSQKQFPHSLPLSPQPHSRRSV